MIVGIIEYFDSAHFIAGHEKCGKMHGHTYKVEVEVEGEVKDDGMVMDFHLLKVSLKKVISKLDHTVLNDVLKVPTAENLAKYIYDNLKPELNVNSVKVWEGEGKYAKTEG